MKSIIESREEILPLHFQMPERHDAIIKSTF